MSHQQTHGTRVKAVLLHQLPCSCIINTRKDYLLSIDMCYP